MTCVIRVIQDGYLGLQLVGRGVVTTAKSFEYMYQLREPPQEIDLMKCTKDMLINTLSPSGRNRFSGWTKQLLVAEIRAYWGNITNDHVEYLNDTDVYGELQSIFTLADGMWEEMAEQRRERRRQSEANHSPLHDIYFFDGQPHMQPPLPVYHSPRTVSTEQVISSDPPEQFIESDIEDDASIDDENNEFSDGAVFKMRDITLNEKNDNEKMAILKIPTINGTCNIKFYIKEDMTGDDLIEMLYIKSGGEITSQNSKIYYGGCRVSIYEKIETWFSEKDDMNIVLRPLLMGGSSKRSRNDPKDKEKMTLKEIRSFLEASFKQLDDTKALSISECVEKVKVILEKCKTDPKNISTAMFSNLGVEKIGKMATVITSCSTRISDRLRFLAEVALEEEFEKIEALKHQFNITEEVLMKTMYLFLLSEFSDPTGSNIQWQVFTEKFTKMLAVRPTVDESDANNCVAM